MRTRTHAKVVAGETRRLSHLPKGFYVEPTRKLKTSPDKEHQYLLQGKLLNHIYPKNQLHYLCKVVLRNPGKVQGKPWSQAELCTALQSKDDFVDGQPGAGVSPHEVLCIQDTSNAGKRICVTMEEMIYFVVGTLPFQRRRKVTTKRS